MTSRAILVYEIADVMISMKKIKSFLSKFYVVYNFSFPVTVC